MASETVFLPCQFCNKMIELKNVDTHQDECQTKHNHLSNDGNNDITIPCEFCEIAIDLNGLMCHQIVCRKKLKNTKNRVPNITEKTESSVYSKNMLLSSETVYYQDEFNQNSSERNTKKSVQDSSCNLNLNSPSTSKNYAVPTLILRKPKLTNDCSCSSPLSSKQSMALPVKYNSDINSAGVINTKNKMHNDRSPFLNSYRRDFQSDSTNKNVSYNLIEYIRHFSASSPNVIELHLASPTDHYRSTYGDKGWGCGYRNMQMLMSSMLLQMDYNEHISRVWEVEKGPLPRAWMPSISRLQQHLEKSWSMGIDEPGREQLGGTVYNTKKWIGATEVVTMLTALKIKTLLIDFRKPTGSKNTHPEMFHWLYEHFSNRKKQFIPPVYIQHEGHSRTVVGVEKLSDGTILLLVLDPSSHYDKLRTEAGMSTMSHIRKSMYTFKAKEYQLVTVSGIITSDSEFESGKTIKSTRGS
ncbi:zinc finger with UFM1-specific peptidase domain protein-like isoform X2 [Myzus persicae]|uniref:zinc finger with UFM1-specific peptidase domain protein-like isoform X2 n=1 Tax=Myzus persicae TaxID=13164 RepID=UPI000B92FF4D|nr:zinc finger with UFM1-specific peptidase domain protein-like isoform X2 [Myzus persicae]